MTPEQIAALFSALNGKKGGQMSSGDIGRIFSPDFNAMAGAMKGGPVDAYEAEPVDEMALWQRNAPNWHGVESGDFYKPESIERTATASIRQGKPLVLVQRDLADALKAQGQSTNPKDPYYKELLALSKTLFDEYHTTSGKVKDAYSDANVALKKKKESSDYAKGGIPDPADYQRMDERQQTLAMEPIIARIAQTYAPIEGTDPKYAAGRERVNAERTQKAMDSAERIRSKVAGNYDKKAAASQRDKSTNAMLQRTILMMAMENPRLLQNPVVQSFLG